MSEHDDPGQPVDEPVPGEPVPPQEPGAGPGSGNAESAASVDEDDVEATWVASVEPGSSTAPPGDPGTASVGSSVPPPGEPPGWRSEPLNQPPLNQPPLNQPPLNQPPLNQPPPNPWAPPGYQAPPGPPTAPHGWVPPVPDSDWAPPGPAGATTTAERNRPAGTARSALIGGFVGALVAALVTAGAFVGFGHDHRASSASAPTALRPASIIVHNGDIQAILRKVQPAVVRIDVVGPDGQGTGTGFIVDPNGVIVTNAHVAADASSIKVTLADSRTANASVVGIDAQHDLAVVKIGLKKLPVVQLGDSNTLEVGDSVVAIGNALALEGTPTVTSGIVSALHRTISTDESTSLKDVIQTDASINPGNSGGPLLDSSGRVIGINTAIASPADANNIGFAIAISSAEPTLKRLESGSAKPAQAGFLGVQVETVDAGIAAQAGLQVNQGAYVADVTPSSPADHAGIRVGDVIVKVDTTAITSASQLTTAISGRPPGQKVDVVVNRNGTNRTFHVTLATRPAT